MKWTYVIPITVEFKHWEECNVQFFISFTCYIVMNKYEYSSFWFFKKRMHTEFQKDSMAVIYIYYGINKLHLNQTATDEVTCLWLNIKGSVIKCRKYTQNEISFITHSLKALHVWSNNNDQWIIVWLQFHCRLQSYFIKI